MQPFPDAPAGSEICAYTRGDCITFRKTKVAFGGLSNMASGFPLAVNDVRILTSEALYQACRFPHLPRVQKVIVEQASPMAARMKSKLYREDSRPDWDSVRVEVMRWCLRVKLAQNWDAFGQLLLSTGDRLIVEESSRDGFWGARAIDENTLVGANVLGRLLMELRDELKRDVGERLRRVEAPQVPNFLLYEIPISSVESPPLAASTDASWPLAAERSTEADPSQLERV
jgi:type I restriction enzyme S subunit